MTENLSPTEAIEKFVNNFIAQWPSVFVVEIKVAAGNSVTVLLDADDGLTIDKCTLLNRALYKFIEENGVFADANFSLEVSSFGVGKPLKMKRQYAKNIGRKLEVVLEDDTKLEGKLTEAGDDHIILEQQTGKGKKTMTTTTTILFNQIKHATVLITF